MCSAFLVYALRQMWPCMAVGRRQELHWRVAYVVAIGLSLIVFLQPERAIHGPWHPPTISRLLAWPDMAIWPILAAAAYAVVGEQSSKRSKHHNSRSGMHSIGHD